MNTDRFVIISGGPGSGKTTLIRVLAARGHAAMPEAGRAIIQTQVAIGGRALHWDDQPLFAELMLAHEMRNHVEAGSMEGLVFFDRGVPELAYYPVMCGFPVPPHFLRAVEVFAYCPTVFISPPWREIFANDAERKQDWAEAVRSYEYCVEAYGAAGYDIVELPLAPVEARADFVLQRLGVREAAFPPA